MSSVAAAPDQRFANEFAFDGGNGMAHKPTNGVHFGGGEFRLTKEHSRHNRAFGTQTIVQCRPSAKTCLPVSKRPVDQNRKKTDSAIGQTWELPGHFGNAVTDGAERTQPCQIALLKSDPDRRGASTGAEVPFTFRKSDRSCAELLDPFVVGWITNV